jgi:deazaflavin-dependent oxidoreductase (nitroreductase family)
VLVMTRIDASTIVNLLIRLGVFEPIERTIVRWGGVSLRSWASTRREGVPYIPTLLLTTIGRNSGELRANALFYLRDGRDLIVVASKSGSPAHPDWYRNVEANAQAWVHVSRRRIPVRAETLDETERARLWPALVTMWPRYEDHQRRATPRVVPVVRLRPIRESR